MALLLMDGFDTYNGVGVNTGLASKWGGVPANCSMAGGRYGGQSVNIGSGGASTARNITRMFPATPTVGVGIAIKPVSFTSITGAAALIGFMKSGTWTLGARPNPYGGIDVFRQTGASSGTLLGSTANSLLTEGSWHFIELGASIHDTNGNIALKIDGSSVLTLANQDTNNGVGDVNTIWFGTSTTSNTGTHQYDDFYLVDTVATLGELRAETIYPTSDVAQAFARSIGSTNYSLVDEPVVNGDTDYVQGSNVGDVDTYGFSDLSSTPTNIVAVQMNAFANKTDAGTRTIALQAKSGATTSDGPSFGLNASYTKFERLMTTDPNTGAAWTAAAVNALQGGPKVIS